MAVVQARRAGRLVYAATSPLLRLPGTDPPSSGADSSAEQLGAAPLPARAWPRTATASAGALLGVAPGCARIDEASLCAAPGVRKVRSVGAPDQQVPPHGRGGSQRNSVEA